MGLPIVRRMLVLISAMALLGGSPASAQGAAGYWTGTLPVTPQMALRVAVEIARANDGTLTGTLDSPDQNAFGIPLGEVAADGETLSFSVPSLQASFAGEWDAAVPGWSGIFVQAGQNWPLVLVAGEPAERPAPVALPAGWAIPGNAALGAVLEQRIEGRDGAGIVLGVLEDDRARIVARGPGGGPAFNGDTLFEIGSMTKVFTALLLAEMALAGEVRLDDRVERYLPRGASMPAGGGKRITLRHLSLHTSGLPRLPDNMPYGDPADPYADYGERELLAFLDDYRLPRNPGESYEYSNLGVGLLGYALARAAGTDFESLLRARILDPLGLEDTAITLSPAQQARFATPHDMFMQVTSPWQLPALAGAGALRSTARDMLAFLAAARDPGSRLAPAMALTLADRLGADGAPQTALGWMIGPLDSGAVLNHGGGTGGFRTHMALQPATGRAVVVLTNAAVEPAAEDIAVHALVGAPLAREVAVPAAPPPVSGLAAVALSAAQLDHVTGTYRLAPGMELTIRREGDELRAQLTGQPEFAITPSAPLEFFWRVADAQIVFREEAGKVIGATLFQGGREVLLQKIG